MTSTSTLKRRNSSDSTQSQLPISTFELCLSQYSQLSQLSFTGRKRRRSEKRYRPSDIDWINKDLHSVENGADSPCKGFTTFETTNVDALPQWIVYSIWDADLGYFLKKDGCIRPLLKETLINLAIQPLKRCFGSVDDPILYVNPTDFVAFRADEDSYLHRDAELKYYLNTIGARKYVFDTDNVSVRRLDPGWEIVAFGDLGDLLEIIVQQGHTIIIYGGIVCEKLKRVLLNVPDQSDTSPIFTRIIHFVQNGLNEPIELVTPSGNLSVQTVMGVSEKGDKFTVLTYSSLENGNHSVMKTASPPRKRSPLALPLPESPPTRVRSDSDSEISNSTLQSTVILNDDDESDDDCQIIGVFTNGNNK